MPAPFVHLFKLLKTLAFAGSKQRFQYHECRRQFLENSTKRVIDPAIRELIDRLLWERISLAGIEECYSSV